MVESEYMEFERVQPEGRKTPIIRVWSKSRPVLLGEIRWYSTWRQFCLWPSPRTIFNKGCLAEIQTQITELMDERR